MMTKKYLKFLKGIIQTLSITLLLLTLNLKNLDASPLFLNQLEAPKIYVFSNQDNDEYGTLRWAIHQANSTSGQVLIDLSKMRETITLNTSLPIIESDLVIQGNPATIISGNHRHRVFAIRNGNVTLKNLNIINGLAQGRNGNNGQGGSAGMGGGLLMEGGKVDLVNVVFTNNQAVGGEGSIIESNGNENPQNTIQQMGGRFYVNRGAITGVNGISFGGNKAEMTDLPPVNINSKDGEFLANRGAVAGVNGIGISGIGAITFGGGGGFGGFGNAGNGGNGGNGGYNGGSGGNGGNGGNGGIGFFGAFGTIDGTGTVGDISFGGGGGFGGFGNAGNGGNGGNICGVMGSNSQQSQSPGYGYGEDESDVQNPIDAILDGEEENGEEEEVTSDEMGLETDLTYMYCGNGGDGGDGGNGGFGGGGGSGGFGGKGGIMGQEGVGGKGGFGAGNGGNGFSGGGAGLGGAIFLKSGVLTLENTRFIGNMAIGGKGVNPGLGKGGAIFMMDSPQVISKNSLPLFQGNLASDEKQSVTDNQNVFGVIRLLSD